jgi:hypothetical protein
MSYAICFDSAPKRRLDIRGNYRPRWVPVAGPFDNEQQALEALDDLRGLRRYASKELVVCCVLLVARYPAKLAASVCA